jgi:histidinol dehydrogenase
MDMAGADEIYCIGGVQAIAAFAHGTESIESVSMIVGPGNSYVAEAKRQCYGKVGIDFVAGPSEVLIIADKYAEPSILAADLLAQCEHDKSARGILLTDSEEIALRTIEEVERQLNKLETADIARAAWEDNSFVYLTDDIWEAVAISNEIAPEHLELMVRNYKIYMRDLRNYGSLFLGKYSAEVFGDYSSGTNHTLPTSGAARYTGGVSVGNFLKTVTYQKITKKGYRKLARHTELMAENEGLQAHANAVRVRR